MAWIWNIIKKIPNLWFPQLVVMKHFFPFGFRLLILLGVPKTQSSPSDRLQRPGTPYHHKKYATKYFCKKIHLESTKSQSLKTRSPMQSCGSGSGIRYLFDPWIQDPRTQTHIFESLDTFFRVKSSIILCENWQKNFLFSISKIK